MIFMLTSSVAMKSFENSFLLLVAITYAMNGSFLTIVASWSDDLRKAIKLSWVERSTLLSLSFTSCAAVDSSAILQTRYLTISNPYATASSSVGFPWSLKYVASTASGYAKSVKLPSWTKCVRASAVSFEYGFRAAFSSGIDFAISVCKSWNAAAFWLDIICPTSTF